MKLVMEKEGLLWQKGNIFYWIEAEYFIDSYHDLIFSNKELMPMPSFLIMTCTFVLQQAHYKW